MMMEAFFGLLGVAVGSLIPWIKDTIHQKRLRAKRATYLAVQVICILDEYVDKCAEVVQDDGTIMGQASKRDKDGSEACLPVVEIPPVPVFPSDVDWKSIDSKLMYRILTLPNSIRITNNLIQFVESTTVDFPYLGELHEARWEGYAKLGLEAIALTDDLREKYELPEKNYDKWNEDWNPKATLEEKIKKIEEKRAKMSAEFASTDNRITDRKGENDQGKRGMNIPSPQGERARERG